MVRLDQPGQAGGGGGGWVPTGGGGAGAGRRGNWRALLRPLEAPPVGDAPGAGRVSAGCPHIDAFLRGGVPTGMVTELVGESTAGKTQLCMQMMLAVQASAGRGDAGGSAVYISTEGDGAIKRLRELAAQRAIKGGPDADTLLANVYHVSVVREGGDEMVEVLGKVESLVSQVSTSPDNKPPVRLVVVDSVANLFRDVDAGRFGELMTRTASLLAIAAGLKRLASHYGLAAVVTNHVVDVMDDPDRAPPTQVGHLETMVSSRRRVTPAMGLTWSACVNARIFVSRRLSAADAVAGEPVERALEVCFAPDLPPAKCLFVVEKDGVWGVTGLPT